MNTSENRLNTRIFRSLYDEKIVELLHAGLTYAEVADMIGCKPETINKYNRYYHKIDIQAAYRRRVEREGIPLRLKVPSSFGYWFSGFFDGEGHIGILSRPLNRIVNNSERGYHERRLFIQIALRDDDTHVLSHIYDTLNIGSLYANRNFASRHNTKANPSSLWKVERLKDLREVIVPLLETYPLQSKKAQQFAIWKRVVEEQYILSLGGRMQRLNAGTEWQARFDAALEEIKAIQIYKHA